MRSRLIVLAVFGLACLTGFAPARAEGFLGVRGGVSVAKADVKTSMLFDEGNRTGYSVTAFASLGDVPLVLQPEISYIEKGVDEVEIDYVEAAVLLKLGVPILPIVKPHAFVGVGADYEVDSKSTLQIDTKELDWTMIFGADVFITVGELALIADARYALGLKDVLDNGPGFDEIKNRAWLLSAGVALPF